MDKAKIPLYEQRWPEGEYRHFQLGFHVDDVVVAAERWARVFAVGPFSWLPRRSSTSIYRGRTIEIEVEVAVAQAGLVQIELVRQFDDSPSIYREIYPRGVVGPHQLCTVTDRYHDKLAQLRDLGYGVAGEVDSNGYRVAYVDTTADFGFVTEVVANQPGILGQFARLARMAQEWDGSDPVRILTSDGYRTP
jgi:hypothetical protein